MLSSWNHRLEACSDLLPESQWDDSIPADDDETSETWTQPWDLPATENCAGYSDSSDSRSGLRDMSSAGTASNNMPTEQLNAKGADGTALLCVFFIHGIVILYLQ